MHILKRYEDTNEIIQLVQKKKHTEIVFAKNINTKNIVETFSFDISEHQDVGKYQIELVVDNRILVKQEFEIAHFKKEVIALNVQHLSWVLIGNEANITINVSYQHGEKVKNAKAYEMYDPESEIISKPIEKIVE